MKKCFYALLAILLIIILLLIPKHENEHEANENTLYNIKIDNTYLRVQKYDNSLGQNQLVGVEKKTKAGYETVTEELITAWDALMEAYEAGKTTGKATWFTIVAPGLTDSFYFTGNPSAMGLPETSVNTVLEITNYITPTNAPEKFDKPTDLSE